MMNNNNNDDFAWMSSEINTNSKNTKKTMTKNSSNSLKNMTINNSNTITNTYVSKTPPASNNINNLFKFNEFDSGVPASKFAAPLNSSGLGGQNEFSSGIPMSKSMPPSNLGGLGFGGQNEFLSGIPMSKSMPPSQFITNLASDKKSYTINSTAPTKPLNISSLSDNDDPIEFNPNYNFNEFNSGVPMSKSGRPIRPKPKRNEFLSGIPMSKSMPPSQFNTNYNFNEFNSGVPMSKSGAPIWPNAYGNGQDTPPSPVINTVNTNKNTNVNKKKSKFTPGMSMREYLNGVSLSKSMLPRGGLELNKTIPPGQDRWGLQPRESSVSSTEDTNTKHEFVIPAIPPPPLQNKYPSYGDVVSIDDILKRDKKALKTLRLCLEARGWCKITYPEKTNKIIKSVMENVHKWFNNADLNDKLKYSRKLKDGKPNPQSEYSYNRIPGFKEGLRILTGDIYNIHYQNNKYPDEVKDEIMKINKEFDTLSVKLMKAIYDTVYNLSNYKQFGDMYDISILNDGDVLKLKYSMLDFVNYYNDKEYIENIRKGAGNDNDDNKTDENGTPKPNVLKSEFNVFAHSDPGLFALSFASTNEGLEMYDHVTKEWIPIGLNEGIWWNGKTAHIIDEKIKSGEHRVKIDDKTFKPRFTGWYEVSCNKQLKPEVMKEALDIMNSNDVNKMSSNIMRGLEFEISAGSNDGFPSKARSVDSINDDLTIDIMAPISKPKKKTKKGMKKKKLKEYDYGVPDSKDMPGPYDNNDGFNDGLNEFDFGVPNSKNNNPAPVKRFNEFNSGVPMSKSWAPMGRIPVNLNNNLNNNNNNNNNNSNNNDDFWSGF